METIQPMLATLTDQPVEAEGWLYELKWDGYRAIAYLEDGKVELRSRNDKSFNEKFYPIYDQLKKLKINAIIDGEIVVLNEKGLPDFSALQAWRSEADGNLVFYVFDILAVKNKMLTQLPLTKRKEWLEKTIKENENIKISKNFNASGKEFFNLAEKMGLEGIMAKKADSQYVPGARSKDWLKIKTEQHQEAIIAGYTQNENSSKLFSALLLGLFENNKLNFIGSVGTGFSTALSAEILKKLKPLITSKCPFDKVPDYNKPSRFRPNPPMAAVTWVKPKLVCEISYRELTKDGSLRHASFRALRPDKSPNEVRRELPVHLENPSGVSHHLENKNIITVQGVTKRNSFLNPADEQQTRVINGHQLKFANLSKIYWPKEKITKRDMLNYYFKIAPFILPYLIGRPQTLNRYPHGIEGQAFYQKDVKGKVPSWIKTFPYHSEADKKDKEFIVCTDEASLLYIASLGCIEINPWSSRNNKPDNPDWCIIDLDPDKNTFNQVIQAANVTKKILDQMNVPSYPKTSGSTGMHIYIPLGGKYTYHDSKEFARSIATAIHQEIPGFTSIERKTADRNGKMYIDFLQNRPQATIAAPYSLRPKPGATVSMPLNWEEVKPGLKIKNFNIFNAVERANEVGDIFKPVLGKGINIKAALKKLDAVTGK